MGAKLVTMKTVTRTQTSTLDSWFYRVFGDDEPTAVGSGWPGGVVGVLAGVLDRDGQQLSATQTRQQALADADHLAVLHALWTAETAPARQQRYLRRSLQQRHLRRSLHRRRLPAPTHRNPM